PKVAAWVVPITPGDTNLFLATDCIINPATLIAEAVNIIVKVLGILEINKISNASGLRLNNVNKFTSRLASILSDRIINMINETILKNLRFLIILVLILHMFP